MEHPLFAHRELARVYIGTYTTKGSKGIYTCRFDLQSGTLGAPRLAAKTSNPSFLAPHPDGKHLYAVNEVTDFQGQASGAVSAFEINAANGELVLLNQMSSRGTLPCHLVVDSTCRNVLVANYKSGSAAVLPVGNDGQLAEASTDIQHTGSSIHPARQSGPHAHSVCLSPDNRFAFVPDLGLDQVLAYRLDARQGTLAIHEAGLGKLKPGAGPRHAAFHPDGQHLYVVNELDSTITIFAFEPKTGALNQLQTLSTLPADFQGDSTAAEVRVHPQGRFLYASNRGHNSIAIFSISPIQGTLTPLGHVSTRGKKPRHFALDPTGCWLIAANQDSNSLVVFQFDPASGALTPTGQILEIPSPVCVSFAAQKV